MTFPFYNRQQRQKQQVPGTDVDSLVNEFAVGVHQKGGNSYEDGQIQNISPIVRMVLKQFMVPWLVRVLNKYTEPQFHQMMNGVYIDAYGRRARGKDIIEDLKRHHRMQWYTFMKAARVGKKYVQVDINYQTMHLANAIRARGWNVYPHEMECFRQNLTKLMKIVYGG